MAGLAPDFDDHGSQSVASQRFEPGPQALGDVGHQNHDRFASRNAHFCKPLGIEKAGFALDVPLTNP